MNLNLLFNNSVGEYPDYSLNKKKHNKNVIIDILFKKIFLNNEKVPDPDIGIYNKKNNINTIPGMKNNYINTFPIFKKIIIIDENKYKNNSKNHLHDIFMLKKWELLKFSPKHVDELKKKLIFFPLPIQSIIIPIYLKGQDFICLAKTGSGKTLCYIVPNLRLFEFKTKLNLLKKTYELLVVPTRELCLQVHKEFSIFLKYLSVKVLCLCSGIFTRIKLYKKSDKFLIIISTPGSLKNYFFNIKKIDCSNTQHIIIDEGDKIFELGFEAQIRKLLLNIRPDKHLSVFCSFLPYNIEINIRRYQMSSLKIRIGGFKELNEKIHQFFEFIMENKKTERLLEILSYWFDLGKIIVFTNTLRSAFKLYEFLIVAGYDPLILHSKLESSKRLRTLFIFKNSLHKILIATSLVSRGLDFFNLNLIVNFEVPISFQDYVNRIGRTGRIGNKGTAITFIGKSEKKINLIFKKINILNNGLENISIIYGR